MYALLIDRRCQPTCPTPNPQSASVSPAAAWGGSAAQRLARSTGDEQSGSNAEPGQQILSMALSDSSPMSLTDMRASLARATIVNDSGRSWAWCPAYPVDTYYRMN